MDSSAQQNSIGFIEFVALAATITSLAALSIDAMLPALPEIGRDLGVVRANDNQLIILLIFLGMSVGQLIYGPISDSTGRKGPIYVGFGLFALGCLMSLFATSFPVMLAGRLLQGIGVAGPRIVTIAIVRDQYEGRSMARVMSFIMTVFILVPIIAPAIGQGLILLFHWRAIFGLFLLMTAASVLWFMIRQPETLAKNDRIPFSMNRIWQGLREVIANRVALGYTITAGLVSSAFLAYLSTAQQIFQGLYQVGQLFPLYFAILAVSFGCASLVNARLVMHYGMRVLSMLSLQVLVVLSIVFFGMALWYGGQPALWAFIVYMLFVFFAVGILFGNMNALAMEPLGHIAGIGAAFVGSVSLFISLVLGAIVGQMYNGTVLPLVGSFAIFGAVAMMVMRWTETGRPDVKGTQS